MNAAPDKHLPRLEALWSQISRRYRDRPAHVYFELFNEPQDKFNDSKWNAVIPKLLAIVRSCRTPCLGGAAPGICDMKQKRNRGIHCWQFVSPGHHAGSIVFPRQIINPRAELLSSLSQ